MGREAAVWAGNDFEVNYGERRKKSGRRDIWGNRVNDDVPCTCMGQSICLHVAYIFPVAYVIVWCPLKRSLVYCSLRRLVRQRANNEGVGVVVVDKREGCEQQRYAAIG